MKNIVNEIELNDEQLEQVVGGCKQYEPPKHNDCNDNWEHKKHRHHRQQWGHNGNDGCGEHGIGYHPHC